MKRLLLLIIVQLYLGYLAVGQHKDDVQFRSTDSSLEKAFAWAKKMALHYRGHPGDPVGPWYESALPPRYAFCMRDVSHQCIGAEILGMHRENKNMFSKFTANISASKDWCTYWEIDKFDRPSPSDYRNDREFWYNLNANFDLLDACWRTYLWTGDTMYLKNPAFLNFYARTTEDFIHKWILQPDSLLTRPAYPNAPLPFNIADPFNRCRGLPSYSEGVPDLKMGVDLVAALYRGLDTYADILKAIGDPEASSHYKRLAKAYQDRIEADWWDTEAALYHTHYTNKKEFGKAEGETFLLWFDVLKDSVRKRKTIEHLQSMDLNVENQSYLPLLYYKNGYWDKAKDLLLHLANPMTPRREYPEVSYGLIEGFVQGLMGVDANAQTRTVSTIYRSADTGKMQLLNLSVLNSTLTLTHYSRARSSIHNTGKQSIKWKALFTGDYKKVFVNKDGSQKIKKEKDRQGQIVTWLEVIVPPGKEINIRAEF